MLTDTEERGKTGRVAVQRGQGTRTEHVHPVPRLHLNTANRKFEVPEDKLELVLKKVIMLLEAKVKTPKRVAEDPGA